jgi:hypothetical protein
VRTAIFDRKRSGSRKIELSPFELARQDHVQEGVAQPCADAAPHRRIDMFQQVARILVGAQVDRDVEGVAADLAQPVDALARLAVP